MTIEKEGLLKLFKELENSIAYKNICHENCRDCINVHHCYECHSCISLSYSNDCTHCNHSMYLHYCHFCRDCDDCYGCYGCSYCKDCFDCILCTGLKYKASGYWLLNKKVTKKEFKEVKKIMGY